MRRLSPLVRAIQSDAHRNIMTVAEAYAGSHAVAAPSPEAVLTDKSKLSRYYAPSTSMYTCCVRVRHANASVMDTRIVGRDLYRVLVRAASDLLDMLVVSTTSRIAI